MSIPHRREAAILAVIAVSDALGHLATYVNEGPALLGFPFSEVDPASKLAEAIIRTAEIEIESYRAAGFDEESEQLDQLIAACRRFYLDWTARDLEGPVAELGDD